MTNRSDPIQGELAGRAMAAGRSGAQRPQAETVAAGRSSAQRALAPPHADGAPIARLTKGERTRARLVAAAEEVFGEGTYDEASIVEITRRAGVSQGTFYLYFPSKLEIFREVVRDLGHQLRARLARAVEGAPSRAETERRGLEAFFSFVTEHPELYRIIRQSEFVDRDSFKQHYQRLAQGYREGLAKAMDDGEVRTMDPEVLAYCLMGVSEIVGMRWLLWESDDQMPGSVAEDVVQFMLHGALNEPGQPRSDRGSRRRS